MRKSAVVLLVNETHFYKDISTDPDWVDMLVSDLWNATLFPPHSTSDQAVAEAVLSESGHSYRPVFVDTMVVTRVS